MKKFNIVFINIFLFLCLFFGLNYYLEKNVEQISFYLNSPQNLNDVLDPDVKFETEEYPEDFERLEYNPKTFAKYCNQERLEYGMQYKNKRPIAIMGCSYAYGHGLKNEETFAYVLSEYLKRPVYSFAHCGGHLEDSYNKMNGTLDEKEFKNVEYFIYVYMYDHINRYLQQPIFMYVENLSKDYKTGFGDNIFIIRYIKSSIRFRSMFMGENKHKKINAYLKTVIKNHYEKMKEKNPNSKFIVIVYNEKIPPEYNVDLNGNFLNSKAWDELANETDIIIVKTKDVMGFPFNKDYKLKADIADWHPNARAWKEFTPKFADKYIK